ncbi:beta-galactosidase [Kitasatospora sp. GP30]|uniref:beta-galactosidase n=1 Tax=Kitasatospora sp. GP30 TaxID=3035084 RepID=UPI000C707074|nr:beta-galactosidase [Kitasatospora sp. GP30]MDH6142352.1 beta-galactosidase [Kitasatospora sp. GP30]
MSPGRRPSFVDGTLWLDGRPRFLIAGEYPYYRDDPERWAAKLDSMREAGIEVVTCYVPWRHHEIACGDLCFAGDGNRDLVGFLELIAATGLLAVLKPGPFVHAELPFGGLPDRISPTLDPGRHAARSADGRPLPYQQFVLPSALDPAYLADATGWLRAVGLLLRPFLHPGGPVVAVQIGNEGHYGETALPLDALDYSQPGAQAFARFAPGVAAPTLAEFPCSANGLLSLASWARWSAELLAAGMAALAEAIGPDVPVFTTYSPPARTDRDPGRAAGRYDAWLVRNRVGAVTELPRAYTSWTGNVISDEEALVNYVLAAKGGRGPNIEENWGLRWADSSCAFPVVPIHHTLLGVACGATGVAVYPACATAGWGEHLAVAQPAGDSGQFDPPYGDAAPILLDATPGPAFAAVRVLTHFLAGRQHELAVSRPENGVRWGVHPTYAAVGAWDWAMNSRAGHGDWRVPSADRTLVPFVAHCLRRNLPFQLAELTGRVALDPAAGPLVAASGRFMERALQQRLARFGEHGGSLLVIGELPTLDEDLRPCVELADAMAGRVRVVSGDGQSIGATVEEWLNESCDVPARARPGAWLELRRTTADPQEVLVFLFNRTGEPLRARTVCGERVVAADLVGGGCAVVQVSHGRLGACYVKGLNEQTGDGVPVRVRVGRDLLRTDRPCDLSALRGPSDLSALRGPGDGPRGGGGERGEDLAAERGPGGFEVRTVAVRGEARVVLPEIP